MTRRISNLGLKVSIGLMLCTLLLSVATFKISPWDHHISLAPHFHVSAWRIGDSGGLGSLVIFNSTEYGPYRGSIVMVDEAKGDREVGLDFPGVYYRHFLWHDGGRLWTMAVSLWYFLVLFTIWPIIWIIARICRGSKYDVV